MYDLILRDATIVHSGGRLVADVAIEGGRVAYVGGNPAGKAREELSAIGRFLIPGVIDGDVAIEAPGADPAALWASESRASVAQGVTTLLHRARGPQAHARLDADLAAAASASIAAWGAWAVLPAQGALAAQTDAVAAGRACGLSLCVGHEAADPDRLRQVHAETAGLLGVLAEDDAVVGKQLRKWQAVDNPAHNDIHPPKAALQAARLVLDLARAGARPMHVHQLTTAGELNLYDPFHDDVPLTTGVTLPHLFHSTDTIDEGSALYKTDPPIRPELDRRALWAAIKRSRVEVFCSGHVPLRREQKLLPYWQAPAGLPAVEVLLPLLLGAVKHGRLGMEKLVEMCCEAPARIFGLPDKGRVVAGADADLVLFSEGETTRLKDADVRSAAGWSPYVGRELGVPPQLVLVGGRVVARDGKLAGDPGLAGPARCAQG